MQIPPRSRLRPPPPAEPASGPAHSPSAPRRARPTAARSLGQSARPPLPRHLFVLRSPLCRRFSLVTAPFSGLQKQKLSASKIRSETTQLVDAADYIDICKHVVQVYLHSGNE